MGRMTVVHKPRRWCARRVPKAGTRILRARRLASAGVVALRVLSCLVPRARRRVRAVPAPWACGAAAKPAWTTRAKRGGRYAVPARSILVPAPQRRAAGALSAEQEPTAPLRQPRIRCARLVRRARRVRLLARCHRARARPVPSAALPSLRAKRRALRARPARSLAPLTCRRPQLRTARPARHGSRGPPAARHAAREHASAGARCRSLLAAALAPRIRWTTIAMRIGAQRRVIACTSNAALTRI